MRKTSKMLSGLIGTTLDQYPYYTPFIAISTFVRTKNEKLVPYMGVRWTGTNLEIQYNEKGMRSLTPQKRIGVLQHELAHYYLSHLTGRRQKLIDTIIKARWPNISQFQLFQIRNIALDLEINSVIPRDHLPEKGCFPENFGWESGLLAEEYLRLMPDEQACQSGGGGGDKDGEGMPVAGDFFGADLDPEAEGQLMDALQEQDMKERMKEARSRGNMPAEIERLLDKLSPPQVRWKAFFRKVMLTMLRTKTTLPTYSRPHRRGLPIAGKMYKQKPPIYVCQDTSGSVSSRDLAILSSELFGMRRHASKITVVVCDAAVHKVYEFKGKIESVAGGGGSDFQPAIDYIRDDHKGLRKPFIILLTDGDIAVPEASKMPGSVIWVLCQGDRNVPYGQKIVLDS